MKVGNTTHNQWASKIINDIGEKEYCDLFSLSNEEITISPHYSKNADSIINPDKLLFPKTWNIMGDIDCSNNIDLNEEIKKLLEIDINNFTLYNYVNEDIDKSVISRGNFFISSDKFMEKTDLNILIEPKLDSIDDLNLNDCVNEKFKLNISQILLTLDDTEERRRSINAKRTFENLFQLNFIPVVNENDTIATSEIKYGDNDRLASRVAQITNADTLILLSDVDGLFTKNPKLFKDAKLIKKINNFDKDIKNINMKGITEFGKGGMITKIEAAKICNLSGCNMIIANGLHLNPIDKIIKKNNCTLFISKISKLHARKKWIISSVSPKGEIIIDDGAKKALVNGKSLLAAGIKKSQENLVKVTI